MKMGGGAVWLAAQPVPLPSANLGSVDWIPMNPVQRIGLRRLGLLLPSIVVFDEVYEAVTHHGAGVITRRTNE